MSWLDEMRYVPTAVARHAVTPPVGPERAPVSVGSRPLAVALPPTDEWRASWAALRISFDAAIAGAGPGAADRLCESCVRLLEVDGAAISMSSQGFPWATVGSSGVLSRRLEELQVKFGEGPSLDAFDWSRAVMAADLEAPNESRWPTYASAVLDSGLRAVYALPIAANGLSGGALGLFRRHPGTLAYFRAGGAILAAEVAGGPMRDLLAARCGGNENPLYRQPHRR